MREKNKIAIYITTKSRQATTYMSGFFNYLQLMRNLLYYIFLATPDIDTIIFRRERYLSAIDIINIGTARLSKTGNRS